MIFFRAENIVEEMTVVALALVSAPVKGDFTTLLKTFSQVFHMFRFRIPNSDVHLTIDVDVDSCVIFTCILHGMGMSCLERAYEFNAKNYP